VLRRAAGDLLPPLEALVRNGGDTAVPYRLRTVPLDSRDAADRLCDRLNQRGIACLVIRHGTRAWRPLA
jgi:repressor of nif and glnA expression